MKFKISECRKFLKDKSTKDYKNIYTFINKYVELYDNQESQYMIQTSQAYRNKVYAEKKILRFEGKLMSEKEYFEATRHRNKK